MKILVLKNNIQEWLSRKFAVVTRSRRTWTWRLWEAE